MGFMSFTGILGVLHVRECDKPNGSCHDFIQLPSGSLSYCIRQRLTEAVSCVGYWEILGWRDEKPVDDIRKHVSTMSVHRIPFRY